jgi:hypothetical protein
MSKSTGTQGGIMADIEVADYTASPEASSSVESEFQDTPISCVDCNNEFIWTAGEQVFFRDKQLQNPPKR